MFNRAHRSKLFCNRTWKQASLFGQVQVVPRFMLFLCALWTWPRYLDRCLNARCVCLTDMETLWPWNCATGELSTAARSCQFVFPPLMVKVGLGSQSWRNPHHWKHSNITGLHLNSLVISLPLPNNTGKVKYGGCYRADPIFGSHRSDHNRTGHLTINSLCLSNGGRVQFQTFSWLATGSTNHT